MNCHRKSQKNDPTKNLRSDRHHLLTIFGAIAGLVLTSSAYNAWADNSVSDADVNIHIASIDEQDIGLGATLNVLVNVTADSAQTINFAVDPEEYVDQIQNGDVSIQANPSSITLDSGETKEVQLTIRTKTSAVSYDETKDTTIKKFGFVVKSTQGSVLSSLDIPLKVKPEYMVTVIDGTDKDHPYDFDSETSTAYFRPNNKGIQFIFKNLSNKHLDPIHPVIIHGDAPIEHEKGVLDYNGVFPALPAITPAAGANVKCGYTIHGVYHPYRSVVLNADQIPANDGSAK